MKNRADQQAKTSPQATPTAPPASTPGASKEKTTTGANPVSKSQPDISHSWYGAIRRVWAVAGRIVGARKTRRVGMWFVSIGRRGMWSGMGISILKIM